jgi:hypothetical protein
MRQVLIDALITRFQSYEDLMSMTSEIELAKKIEIPKHKSLAEHLWCVIGARESYARSITSGRWEGFNCSMSDFSHSAFEENVRLSAAKVVAAIDDIGEWNKDRDELLLALSEHEVMHEGQIIRHLYGTESQIPDSVKWA